MVTSAAEGTANGKAARAEVPRSSHAHWEPAPGRADPVALLEEESAARVQELVPIRYARMAVSAFTFFRGCAGVMAADLSTTPKTGMDVQLCGDAHLLNFGGFGSPERTLLFDLNDFDETLPGPWEWDVKRLAASIVIAVRDRGGSERESDIAQRAVREYRRAMRRFAQLPVLDVWYARVSERELTPLLQQQLDAKDMRRFGRNVAKAQAKDSTRAFAKLTYRTNGKARIAADPPLIMPIEDLVPAAEAEQIDASMEALLARYRETLPHDRQMLLDRYRYAHAARKVVGVGSVGTRAWVLLLLGRDHSDPLFLQAKEAEPSVLQPYTRPCEFDNQGQRVVEGQRAMQSASDIFLGWLRAEGIDGKQRDFYIRQLWDWKASADLDQASSRTLALYTRLCAWTLARAHARTGDAGAIASYLGGGDAFDRAIAGFAEEYADQNERDYEAFMEAIRDGRLAAESPVPA